MEVRIGVQHTARDIAFESKSDQESVAAEVSAAIESGSVLTLIDDKQRRYLIPADKIAYVELGDSSPRRVGFGAG